MALRTARTLVVDAGPADSAAMAEIHEQCFDRSWSAEEVAALLADRATIQGIVVRRGPPDRTRITGFILMRSAAGEAEILTLAVEPRQRRRGYGRQLVEEATRRAYRDRAEALFLEVDETNQSAVSLYRRLGFETVGQRSRYYEESSTGPGTALVMRLRLR